MRQPGYKKVYLLFSSALIFLLHLPFAFAKSRPVSTAPAASPAGITDSCSNEVPPAINPARKNIYDSLQLGSRGLARQAYEYAMQGVQYLAARGRLANETIVSIIDFTRPSSVKRLFVLDLKNYRVLFHTYVAHGMNSGLEYARQFSNVPESNQSSLGFYVTSSTYMGGNGYSLRLNGLERGINDNAARRDIVMHGADYVNEDFIHSQGFIGRSWGCPAVSPRLSRQVINTIKNGTCLFIYSNSGSYLRRSAILNHG